MQQPRPISSMSGAPEGGAAMNDRTPPGSRYPTYARPERPERYEGTAKPAPRRTLQVLPVALGLVAGVLLVIVGAMLLSRSSAPSTASTNAKTPAFAPTARQLCDDLTSQRYDDLYSLLAPAQQQIGPRDQFVAVQRQLDAQLGAVHSCVYSASQRDANHVSLTLSLTRGSSSGAKAQAQLAYEEQGWRISDYDTSLVAAPDHPFHRAIN
jgi:hypothetical protein